MVQVKPLFQKLKALEMKSALYQFCRPGCTVLRYNVDNLSFSQFFYRGPVNRKLYIVPSSPLVKTTFI